MFDMLNTPYMAELAAAGVQPEEVDYVLCTHLHIDHVGWNTKLLDGRWVPTFPNAKYIFARTEFNFWQEHHRTGQQTVVPNVYDDSVLPVVEAGQAVIVDNDYELDHGIWFEHAPGHTAGNIVINVASVGNTAILTGDVVHHPLQLIRPEWSSRACEDPIQSAQTRQTLLERLADSDTLMASAHFAAPTCGHVHRHGDEFRFEFLR
jgi:glyoxylase-like metal-dependent hydrolase (beta-lactamase superfamily II)